jgi:carboxyl-terminal processing protease
MKSWWVLAAVIFADLAIGIRILDSSPGPGSDDDLGRNALLFSRALQLVRQDYVDEDKVSYQKLIYSALHGMLEKLDPHSQFVEPVDFKEELTENRGEMSGLGIMLSPLNGVMTIVSSIEDTPAARAGIAPGDQVRGVNGISTEHKSFDEVGRLLRGEPGQSVQLTIYRPTTKQTLVVGLRREFIRIPSVRDAKMLNSAQTGNLKIGYLRITEFVEPTPQELDEQLKALQARGMQALIVDLRFNPGGLVRSAVDACGAFLPPRTMVVYTVGRDAAQNQQYFTEMVGKPRPTFPLAVLVNGETASAAEIVAGALKDLKRAILVGETTFGKGVVQTETALPDGSAIRLTTAKYYTPDKQEIQGRGIVPDIHSTLTLDEEHTVLAQRQRQSASPEEQKPVTQVRDPQLERAIDALRGYAIFSQG